MANNHNTFNSIKQCIKHKYMQNSIENEGFLYINMVSEETFKCGEISDTDNKLICSGIIVPIINPIEERKREPYGDDHLISIDSCKEQFALYCPLNKTVKLRIYWDQTHEWFMVSNERRIYPSNDEKYDLSSVNFDLLDKNYCYYCNTDKEKGVILTNIVDKTELSLESCYNIHDDLAFEHHIEWLPCLDANSLLARLDDYENGILFVLEDGRQIEIRHSAYNYYCMLAKPDHISIYLYYIFCLNKHAEGSKFSEYFHSLQEYVKEFLGAYPEHTAACQKMTKKILNFIHNSELLEDNEAIDAIKALMEMEPEEALKLLL